MYFSTSIPEGRLSTSMTSLYDISPLPTATSDSTSYQTSTCAYPSWPRRPSLHSTSSSASTSSRSSSPISMQRRPTPEVINAWIPDDDIFPEGGDLLDEGPVNSPVGSLPRAGSNVSLSNMSHQEMNRRMKVLEARRVAAAITMAKEQQRRRRRSAADKRASV